MKDHPRRRAYGAPWALGVLLVLATMLLGFTSVASATDHRYCNSLVPPHTACSTSATGVYYLNTAHYPGTGTVSVCVHDYVPTSGTTIVRVCAPTTADDYPALNNYFYNQFPVKLTAGNDSSYSHTIWGDGTY